MIVQNSNDRHIFLYAAKAKSFFKIKLSTEEDYIDLVDKHFNHISDLELLNMAFNKTIDSETFQKSGYRNGSPVAFNFNEKSRRTFTDHTVLSLWIYGLLSEALV